MMSEEQQSQNTQPENTQLQNQSGEAAEAQETQVSPDSTASGEEAKTEERGRDFVEFPDQQTEDRFKRVYGHMKQNERALEEMGRVNKALLEKVEKLEQTQHEGQTRNNIEDLRQQKAKAYEDGDFTRVAEIDERIIELKLEKPKTDTVIKETESTDELPTDDRARILSWSNERDADGRPVRPWAQEDSPQFPRTLGMIQAVRQDTDNVEEILKEVDRIMNPQSTAKPNQATVLASDPGARPREKGKTKLTPEERMVAQNMEMTPEQYAKAKERWSKTVTA